MYIYNILIWKHACIILYILGKNIGDKLRNKIISNNPIKPVIYKKNNSKGVAYQFLEKYDKLCNGLDYTLIVYSMLSCLYLLYFKFKNNAISSSKWKDAIQLLDKKISLHILKPITMVLIKLTNDKVINDINKLLPTMERKDIIQESIAQSFT